MSDRDSNPAPGPAAPAPAASPEPPVDEFAHIPSRRRPPVVALAATALALLLAVRLRHDVAYALSPSTPVEVSDARALSSLALERLPLNRYVRLRGRPERESAVVLDTKGSWRFNQFFRLRGTNGRAFVRRVADPLPPDLAERDVFTGRLVAFANLSFAESITRYFAERVTGTHFFTPEALLAVLGSDAATRTAVDRAGETVTLRASDRIALDVALPERVRVKVRADRRFDLAKVRAAVTDRAGVVSDESDTPDAAAFTAALPADRRTEILSVLTDLGHGIDVRPARQTIEVPLSDLRPADGGIRVAGRPGDPIAMTELISARTRAAVEVPPDAVLLVEGAAPKGELKSLVILAFLAAFAAVNLLGLRRVR